MMGKSLARAVVVALLLAGTVAVSVASDFSEKLELANEIRTSDTARFGRLLGELDQAVADATPVERLQLRLLHAYRLSVRGDLDGAIREAKGVVDSADADLELRYRAGSLMANIHALTRDFTEGLAIIEQSLLLVDRIADKEVRQQGLLAASILYNQVGQFKLGEHYAQRVLSGDPGGRSRCIAGNLRLEALQGRGMASGDEAYRAAIDLCRSIGEPIPTGLVRSYLARKWYAEGKVQAAVQLLEEHLPEVEATGYAHLIAEYHALISEYRMTLGQYDVATRHAVAAVERNEGVLSTLPLVTAYRILYTIAERRGDIAGAFDLYRKYADADKAYLNEIQAREMAFQLVRHETLQKNQQIELLNQQNRVLELQQEVTDKTAQNSQLMLALLVGLLASIGYWAFKTKRLQVSLRRMAEVDTLTGICNRHHFTQKAEKVLAQCRRSGEQAALVMFDLDHFKLINDRFGHAAGDWALKQVATACAALCRSEDCLGRLGGEEFAMLLPGCDAHAARDIAEGCRARLAALDTAASGYEFGLTASFGVAGSATSGYDLARLLSHADKALYRAKRDGRNRVRVYGEEGAAPASPGFHDIDDVEGPPAETDAGKRRRNLAVS